MELLQQESSRFGAPTTTRNLSSSSSAFVSASQSPFFSPRSPKEDYQLSESNRSDNIYTSSSVSQSQPVIIRNAYSHRPPIPISYSLHNHNTHNDIPSSSHGPSSIRANQLKHNQRSALCKESSFSNAGSNSTLVHRYPLSHRTLLTSRPSNAGQNNNKISFARTSASLSSSARLRSCDVYIGTHGQKPSLLRFTKWLRVELELQGIACFAADRARYTDSRSHDIADKVISSATFGVVIITKKSFANPYSIEELRIFLGRKNLVPLFFDLGPGDCLARDIIEKRGELWEKQGGNLWMLYDGDANEWKEAMDGLSRVTDEWRLEAHAGNWRSCILRAVSLLGSRLGRRSVAERERVRKVRIQGQEYPFPRNPGFVGRKKELLELEEILFGKADAADAADDGILDIKIRPKRKDKVIVRRRSNGNRSRKQAGEEGERKMENRRLSESDRLKDIEEGGGEEEQNERRKSEADKWELKGKGKNVIPVNTAGSTKGKELAIWKESENEIEIQRGRTTQRTSDRRQRARILHRARYAKRNKETNLSYGRGIACVSGESGIGKTELVLEFAYRFAEKYRLVLWVGGETRYLRQNFLNLSFLLGLDVSTETHISPEKGRNKTFEEQEMEALQRVRKELVRDIPYLLVIDNLESERDWWDGRDILELLPRFGGTTHVIISTRLPRVMNLDPLRLSYLSSVEAMSLMKGKRRDLSIMELDALRTIEERLSRLTLGLGLVGTILSELPITPSRLLDTINRVPLRDLLWGVRDDSTLRNHPFLMQLLDVCFSILDHADEPKNLASRMALVGAWFAPYPTPISLLAVAASKLPERKSGLCLWKRYLYQVGSCFLGSQTKRSEVEASDMLIKFRIARSSTRHGWIHMHEMIQLKYSHRHGQLRSVEACSIMEFDMAYDDAPDFYEFEVSPHWPPPSPLLPMPMTILKKTTPGEHLKTGLLAAAVFSFIFLIAKDAHKAFTRRAHWIPCDFLVLSAFSIQMMNLLSAQNEALSTSANGKFSIKEAAESKSNADLWKEFLMIHNSRTIMCVLVAYVMPGMANRGPEHAWGRLVALAISVLHHVMSELYIEDSDSKVSPSFLRLWPRQNGLSDPLYFTLATTISLCFATLLLLLGSANVAGRGIERIRAKKISLVLRGEGEFSSELTEKTHEGDPRHHAHPHSCWRTVVRGEEDHHRRHCHYCWRTVEDAVLKAWIIVRAYSLQHVIGRSALTALAAVIVTIQIMTTIVGGLAEGANRNNMVKDRVLKFVTTVLQCVFILIGWSIIIWRWASAVSYYRRQDGESWRSSLRVEDFWTRHLRELQQGKESRLRQAQSLNNKIEKLVAKEQIRLSLSNTLLSAMIVLQWLLVSFSKACWFASLMLMQNKLMVKFLSLIFPKQEMYVFEDYPKYKKILEDVEMLGEGPKSLWVSNRKSIEKARNLIIQGEQDGEYNCEHLVEFLINKRTTQGLGLSCLEPYKPQTGLKYLCSKRPTEEMTDVEKQQQQGGNAALAVEERFIDVSTESWKMTAVALIIIIVHLSPVNAEVDKADSSNSHDFPPKAIKDCLDAYSQAWEIVDFVEDADIVDDGFTSEAAGSVEEADVKDDRFISKAADRYFKALQMKIDKASKTTQATPDSVLAALKKLKTESKSKTNSSRKENIVSLVRELAGKKEEVQGPSNDWKGNDSIDWQAAALCSAVYKLFNSIEWNGGSDVSEVLKELESCLADIINECLEKVQRLLLLNSRKWALRSDEKRMAKALYTAGKAKVIMEKL